MSASNFTTPSTPQPATPLVQAKTNATEIEGNVPNFRKMTKDVRAEGYSLWPATSRYIKAEKFENLRFKLENLEKNGAFLKSVAAALQFDKAQSNIEIGSALRDIEGLKAILRQNNIIQEESLQKFRIAMDKAAEDTTLLQVMLESIDGRQSKTAVAMQTNWEDYKSRINAVESKILSFFEDIKAETCKVARDHLETSLKQVHAIIDTKVEALQASNDRLKLERDEERQQQDEMAVELDISKQRIDELENANSVLQAKVKEQEEALRRVQVRLNEEEGAHAKTKEARLSGDDLAQKEKEKLKDDLQATERTSRQFQAYSDILAHARALLLWQKAYASVARPSKLRRLVAVWISLVKEKNQTLEELSTTSKLQIQRLEEDKREQRSKAQAQMLPLRKRIQDLDVEKENLTQAKNDDVGRLEAEKENLSKELNQLSLDYSSHRATAIDTLAQAKASFEEKLQAMTSKNMQADASLQAMTDRYEKEKAGLKAMEKKSTDYKNQLQAVTNLYEQEKSGLEYMVAQSVAEEAKVQRSLKSLEKANKKLSRRENLAKQSTQRTLQAMVKSIDPSSSYVITDAMTNDYLTIENSLFSPSSVGLSELVPPAYDDNSLPLSPIKWYGSKPSSLVAHWAACYLDILENEQAVTDLLSQNLPPQWQETIPWIVSSCAVLLDGLKKSNPDAKAIAMGLYHLLALCLVSRHSPRSFNLRSFCQGTVNQWQKCSYIQRSSLLSALYQQAQFQLSPGERYFWTVAAVRSCRDKLIDIEPDPAAQYRVLDPSNSDLTNLTLFLDAETTLFCAIFDIGQPTESVAIYESRDIKSVSWGSKGRITLCLHRSDSALEILEALSLQDGFRENQWVARFVVCIEEKLHILV